MKAILFIPMLFFFSITLKSQTNDPTSLKPGDPLPDFEFPVIINSEKKTARLSDYRGKVVILDLWSLICGSCIKSLPGYAQLQEEFKKEVVILPVSFLRTREQMETFFQKQKEQGKSISLPNAVFNDFNNELAKLFILNDGFPYIVWVDREGKLITTNTRINANLIKQYLSGKSLSPMRKKKESFENQVPLLLKANQDSTITPHFGYLITGYIDSFQILRQKAFRDQNFTQLLAINCSIDRLIYFAKYSQFNDLIFNKRLVLEVDQPGKFLWLKSSAGIEYEFQKNAWCYELILPSTFTVEEAKAKMYADLCQFFRVTTNIQKRKKLCWILRRKPGNCQLESISAKTIYTTHKDRTIFSRTRFPIKNFITDFDEVPNPIIIDETGYNLIDIRYTKPTQFDLKSIQLYLSQFGLELVPEEREIEMIVIKDID